MVIVDGQRPAQAYLDSIGHSHNAQTIALVDEYRDLAAAVSSERPAEIWRTPIFTVSLSESGFERVYQGTTLVHKFSLRLVSSPTRLLFTVHTGTISEVLRRAFALAALPG